jgi:DNA-binding transcriptional ArsR family regulator
VEIKNSYKQEVISILVEIRHLVSEHIKVQNSIFDPSVRSRVRIPFFSKKIDFESLNENLKKIQADIYKLIKKLQKDKKELNIDPFIYGGIKEYALLFHTSSDKLSQITLALHLEATKQKKLVNEEYNKLVNEYQLLENSRLQKGTTIQKIAILLAEE